VGDLESPSSQTYPNRPIHKKPHLHFEIVFVLIDSFTMLNGERRAVVLAVTLYHLVWQQEELFFVDYDHTQISVTATDRNSLVFTEFQDGKQSYQLEKRFSYWGWH
jgi:hypothetical protein